MEESGNVMSQHTQFRIYLFMFFSEMKSTQVILWIRKYVRKIDNSRNFGLICHILQVDHNLNLARVGRQIVFDSVALLKRMYPKDSEAGSIGWLLLTPDPARPEPECRSPRPQVGIGSARQLPYLMRTDSPNNDFVTK